MWVDKVYSKTERDTDILNLGKFRKISEIPYQNEPKNCSLKLETQNCNFRNLARTEFKIIFHNIFKYDFLNLKKKTREKP